MDEVDTEDTLADDDDTTDADGLRPEEKEMMEGSKETFDFQADVSRIMDIIINSLYTHKEVFLRELISNASDALDKVKYSVLKDPEYLGDKEELEIKIEFDKDEKTLSIIDSGIGMTKADLIKNLGTVAKSGTTQFLELIGKTQDVNLIGQFGVGFYSAYLVANRVTVTSKSNNDPKQHIWRSSADGKFSVSEDPRGNTLKRGSKVTLHLKDDAVEFSEQDKIKELVSKYSLFINYPIYMYISKEVTKQVEIEDEDNIDDEDETYDSEDKDEETDDEDEDKEDVEVSEEDEDDEDKDEKDDNKKTITETIWEWELINKQQAIWLRNKNDVTEEEYIDFYKGVSKDNEDPLTYNHFVAEGDIEFRSILYIPSHLPNDAYENYYGKSSSLKLYVRRVLISDEFEDLIPRYLNFMKGVVDSDDLPLNVSREQLQQLKLIKVMSKKIVRKSLDMMRRLAEEEEDEEDEEDEDYDDEEEAEEEDTEQQDEEKDDEDDEEGEEEESKYENFWNNFGKNIKLGVIEDAANRSKLAKLLRFYSTQSKDELTSLDEYLARVTRNQDAIYYLPGDTKESILKSPLLKKFEKHGLEVLLLTDPIDEFCMQHLAEYQNKKKAKKYL
jgi:heat shock protein beta